ncbi:5-oxoprolinase subunit PxpA [candidate division KSB3 bacterium]|uniref:5-oxoprolinase subunit A n=1 Tax=candidate division KSB3 bacterium TaxID=2044937 RepID=A0A9D5JZY2_9BACT|nr:5-oxoprolinase subunit PxpA [candidate division KSB3 bacterium]MBD3327392.1 5-oxoprolinase subunit PxpA [candidate division KSB3 bacterium]
MKIDLNCDMGESFGRYTLGLDTEVMPLISSANIACGFHAGDPMVMRKTVELAVQHGVAIGAHPGYPDLGGFGRRKMELRPAELHDIILYQVGALQGFARMYGTTIQHVKPHGALYNMAADDEPLANALVEALLHLHDQLILFGLAGSRLLHIASQAGVKVAHEVFADRAYHADGSLVSRQQPGAVITDSSAVTDRVLQIVTEHTVTAITGQDIPIEADTICVHGDTVGALEHIARMTTFLRAEGIQIVPVGTFVEPVFI